MLSIRIHCSAVVRCRAVYYLYYFYYLAGTVCARENRSPHSHLSNDAANGPYVYFGVIKLVPEYKLRSSIVSRTDISDILLSFYQFLSTAEVTDLKVAALLIYQYVLRLYVSVANPFQMAVTYAFEHLIQMKLS